MSKNKYLSLFIVLLLTVSCKSQENEAETSLEQCIQENLNKNIEERTGKKEIDFYEMVIAMEKVFLDNNLLKENKKDDYLGLLESISKSDSSVYEKVYSQQNEVINAYGFIPFSTETIFNQCPYKASVELKEGKGKYIYAQGVVLNKLMAKGYDDMDLIKELINTVDENNFDKIVYRAPVVLLVMINIDLKFNPVEPMEKFEVGGKTYFRPKKKD